MNDNQQQDGLNARGTPSAAYGPGNNRTLLKIYISLPKLPNAKDEPRPRLARHVRQHGA